MIKFENVKVVGFEEAVKGIRNADRSWSKSDSYKTHIENAYTDDIADFEFFIGKNDLKLMRKNENSTLNPYRKFINVYVDITAPFSWWSKFDKYSGKNYVACNCHLNNSIYRKPFELDDFSWKELKSDDIPKLKKKINILNRYRDDLIRGVTIKDDKVKKEAWLSISKSIPNCYNYRKTVMVSYYILGVVYNKSVDTFKDWDTFFNWVEGLPYSELITFTDEKV